MELLQATVDNPAVMLTNMVRKKDSSGNHRRNFNGGHSSPDGIEIKQPDDDKKETLRKLSRVRPSSQFLDSGYHFVDHDFPWKREELMRDLDATDGGDNAFIDPGAASAGASGANSILFSPVSRRSRIVSDGSEDVFEPETGIADVTIDMQEDRNEEQRRMQANLKWNLRRQKIEQEINRIRHYSINKSRALAAGGAMRLRHSVSFGDDLEIQLETSQLRSLEEVDEEAETEEEEVVVLRTERTREKMMHPSLNKKSFTLGPRSNISKAFRSMSTPVKDVEEIGRPSIQIHPSQLQTYKEDDEEEDDDDEEEDEEERVGCLGLPPKDVPMNLSTEKLEGWTDDNNEVD